MQGAFKFGFFEYFKQLSAALINDPEVTAKYKFPIYMVSLQLSSRLKMLVGIECWSRIPRHHRALPL